MDKNKPSRFSPGKEPGKAAHLLVIRLSALGDVAMTVPVLRTLVQLYPELKLTIVSKPFYQPLFTGIPRLNFYAAEVNGKHKGMRGLWKLASGLGALDIDAVADLHQVLRSNMIGLFFRGKGIPVVQIDKGRKEKKALTRKRQKIFLPLKSTPQRYADVFKQLGFPVDLSQHRFPPKKERTGNITGIMGADGNKWIGIAPFAAHKGKTYPPDLMEKVIAILSRAGDYTIILFGGGEAEITALKQWAVRYEKVVNAAGVFSFEEELALISNLDLMVAMDSGNAHLAAIYGVPVLTLWGVTHPFAGFYPFGQPPENALLPDREQYPLIPTSVYGKTCPKDYENAMRSIPPETVVEKMLDILKNSP